jgi:tripartite ATP-independent transporter DctP family solute receptor
MKREMLTTCVTFVAVWLVLLGAASSAAAQTVLRLGHCCDTDSPFQKTAERWSELITKRTNGQVTIKIYPAVQLGSEKDLIEGMRLGTVDAAVTTDAPLAGLVPSFMVTNLPFAFTNYEEAHKFLDGPGGRTLLKRLEGVGIKGFGFIDIGFRSVSNTKRPVTKPDDLKGLKIRVLESPLVMATVNAMGAIGIPMAWGETVSALKQGTVDGVSIGNTYYLTLKMWDLVKYVSWTNEIYSSGVVMISLQRFNSFPESVRKIIAESAAEALPYGREVTRQLEDGLEEKLKQKGLVITRVDPAAFRLRVAPVWKEFETKIGKDMVDELRKATAQ